MTKDKEIEEREGRVAALVGTRDQSWQIGQIEVFNWCLVQVRKAYANADEAGRGELEKLGKHIRMERDARFPKEAANDQPSNAP